MNIFQSKYLDSFMGPLRLVVWLVWGWLSPKSPPEHLFYIKILLRGTGKQFHSSLVSASASESRPLSAPSRGMNDFLCGNQEQDIHSIVYLTSYSIMCTRGNNIMMCGLNYWVRHQYRRWWWMVLVLVLARTFLMRFCGSMWGSVVIENELEKSNVMFWWD